MGGKEVSVCVCVCRCVSIYIYIYEYIGVVSLREPMDVGSGCCNGHRSSLLSVES